MAVYAGDSHGAWAGRLRTDTGEPVAAEFDGTSVTSAGADLWPFPFLPPPLLAAAYTNATPTLDYAELASRGWLEVDLTHHAHVVRFRTVSTLS